ncbi:MAG: DUF3492 domain-containing protein [Exiguobacterium chiriqhucha]|uniref:GT4 family glycosyltransferase PelF n=1 Tax=Exiguobacterium chiriqhucha TaxID=1385984 RepID=UPI0014506393|nr:GT4 family glycosyltransferase PelF [Exiguobacterium chiriqhucha]KAB2862646.1 MAG: DUF3492 domain-containing protein [Exiguobacterium chiriqhucha]
MKICLISEGAYPHVTGGVSSWIQSIITQMPEHDFIVYSISAKELKGAKPKYTLPPNLIELREIHLGDYLDQAIVTGKRYKLTEAERLAFLSLMSNRQTDWDVLFNFFTSGRIDSVMNFLGSKDFYDIVTILCEKRFMQVPFTDMFWALRSMLLPLFVCIDQKVPVADVYHSVSTGYAGVLGALAKYQYGKPLLITEHGIYTREREEEIIKSSWIKGYFKDVWIDYFYSLSNCAYQYADDVSTLFEGNREIQLELGCPPNKTFLIPNGIDVARFSPELRATRPGIHIGAIVRVVPIKDIKTMLQAFALVQETFPDSNFYIIGPLDEDEDYYDECLDLIDTLDLQNVHFTGPVNVTDYLTFMDILVLSSISEGQPLVILEALAMEIPFVSTDVGGCRELLEGPEDHYGPAGTTVPVMHFHLLALEIIKLIERPESRMTYGQNGRERVLNRYTLHMMIDRYKSYYEKGERYGRNRISTEASV